MTFDSSRFTFDAGRDFLGVVMQQGRVQLDSDWNELVSQFLRRTQVGTLDNMGPAIVPRETPQGFQTTLADGGLKIGVGRMYVDGILVENHGAGERNWNAGLAELQGKEPIDYLAQPYYPDPPQLSQAGSSYVVYLDVWQREVTHLQHPELIEKAVGIDTTGRLQTVWQVKILPEIADGMTCSSVDSLEEWKTLTQPSGARLSTSTGAVPGVPDPCQIPPSGGYKGLENQLYRVEIHDGGPMETATFKWSRDNATVASRISHINPDYESIVVESLGRDDVLRFSDGDWIEITDDVRELQGYSGEMRRIKIGGGVDAATNTIVLTKPLPALTFPSSEGSIDPSRNTRVRRWDHNGRILQEDGTVYFDLDSLDSDREGVIPVPDPKTALFLENGILVRFGLASEGGIFHTGDYWNFAARMADASIEILTDAPPRGIHHHYARLAVVTSTADTGSPIVSDCRILWPPPGVGTGHDCSCDRCVKPEDGVGALQNAVDSLAATGGVICLSAGIHYLAQPLIIAKTGPLRIRGKGWRTLLIAGGGAALRIIDSRNVVIENLAALGTATGNMQVSLVEATNTLGLELDHLNLFVLSAGNSGRGGIYGQGVLLAGYTLGFRMRECSVVAEAGILAREPKLGIGLTSAVAITDNVFMCTRVGISLPRQSLHYNQIQISHNMIFGAREVGIQVLGGSLPGSSCLIEGNVLHLLHPTGQAVVAGIDGLRVVDNEILGPGDRRGNSVNGIVLEPGLDPRGIGCCWITGNRIANMYGTGIAVRTFVGSAMIKQNIIERTGRGIAFTDAGSARQLSIENNQLLDIASNPDSGKPVAAIQVLETLHIDINCNHIKGFANRTKAKNSAAVLIIGCSYIRISGNNLSNFGHDSVSYVGGIELIPPFNAAIIKDNIIAHTMGEAVPSSWQAIRVVSTAANEILQYPDVMVIAGRKNLFLLTRKQPYNLPLMNRNSTSIILSSNTVSGRKSRMPLVLVEVPTAISFTANYCDGEVEPEELMGEREELRFSIVLLEGDSVIVGQNHVSRSKSKTPPINIYTDNYTVIGNITIGRPILIRGAELGEPWKALNVK